MEWVDGMNAAVRHIEENLENEIKISTLAKIAACSEFHFQRMFTYICGITPTDYVRRRRLSAAALELASENAKVLTVALKYGYESPTAFNRAFKAMHGVAPSDAKHGGVFLTTYPKITFTLAVKGEKEMNYKIIKKESFRIVGFATHEKMTMEDCFEKVPKFWEKVGKEGGIPKLCAVSNGKEPQGILGVSTCDGGEFSGFYIAVASDKPLVDGMEEYVVPETTYAVFEAVGALPNSIQEVQMRIISEWLPNSGYEYALAPDIEVYPEGDQQSASYRCEVWLPIIKKS